MNEALVQLILYSLTCDSYSIVLLPLFNSQQVKIKWRGCVPCMESRICIERVLRALFDSHVEHSNGFL